MTVELSAADIAAKLSQRFPGAVLESGGATVLVESHRLLEVARFLKETPGLDFDYVTSITAVDYCHYFEVIYHLISIQHNHTLVLKTRCHTRHNPTVPSVVALWQGAELQEREIYDLMGIAFSGHPNLKRILTWEGFPGHPLRRDYL
ncbi:MAG TPA: NADH-quinone oxidoreductase subunit C [Dehalococcoidia bacterium]|jgi:NADH-quinone oxidoreductase subunit C|nr:NADH-quinone oxidoreductase subunit C [Dehalococcoidia bacterium]